MVMSYQIKLDKRSLKAARFISKLQRMIQQALIDSGLTQQAVAEKLGVDRSVINRRLKGKANLTARSIADFAYVLDREISVEFLESFERKGANWARSSISSARVAVKEAKRSKEAEIPSVRVVSNYKPEMERLEA